MLPRVCIGTNVVDNFPSPVVNTHVYFHCMSPGSHMCDKAPCLMLPGLRALFAEKSGPRAVALEKQRSQMIASSQPDALILLALVVRWKNKEEPWHWDMLSIPGDVLQIILKCCVVQMFSYCPRMTKDMFRAFSIFREVCKPFYFAILDHWPQLQEEFFKAMAQSMTDFREDGTGLRNSLTVFKILDTLDPSLFTKFGSKAKLGFTTNNTVVASVLSVFRERLLRHLRHHSCPYLIMMAQNEKIIRAIPGETGDANDVPTLSAFAAYIHQDFGATVMSLMHKSKYREAIALFYTEAPAWNMLPEEKSPSLEEYLHFTCKMHVSISTGGRLSCAPSTLFADEMWPLMSNDKTLVTYITKEAPFHPPPIRQSTFRSRKIIGGMILPMRHLKFESSDAWLPLDEYITMNITTDMLVEVSRPDTIGAFNVDDIALTPSNTLTEDNFTVWSEILLLQECKEARKQMLELDIFRNFTNVFKTVQDILPQDTVVTDYIYDLNFDGSYTPLALDWGKTTWGIAEDRILVDPDILHHLFGTYDPDKGRNEWACCTYLDFSPCSIRRCLGDQEMWKIDIDLHDLSTLTRRMSIHTPRHLFPTAAKLTIPQSGTAAKLKLPPHPVQPSRPAKRKRKRAQALKGILMPGMAFEAVFR